MEQARDIVVNDTQLETAIVGEDILLTPRSPDAQPDAQSDALLAAGDQSTPLTLQTHAVLQWLSQSRRPSAVSSLGMLGCPITCMYCCQCMQACSVKQCSICTTPHSNDVRHLLYTSVSHLQKCTTGHAFCCNTLYTVYNSRRL